MWLQTKLAVALVAVPLALALCGTPGYLSSS
jgi:hypothetical protein